MAGAYNYYASHRPGEAVTVLGDTLQAVSDT